MKIEIRVAKGIRTRQYHFWTLVQQFSLACVCDPEKSAGVSTHSIRAIFCDSKKSRFHLFVLKADLLVREGENLKTPSRKKFFCREC